MHNPPTPATMMQHNKQCHSTMHYVAAPKQHGIINSSAAAHTKMLQHAQCCSTLHKMLWHIAPCLGILHNAMAQKKDHGMKHNAMAQKKHLQHITNAVAQKMLYRMKHSATAQKAAHGTMLQHIVEGHGKKHNAMALIP